MHEAGLQSVCGPSSPAATQSALGLNAPRFDADHPPSRRAGDPRGTTAIAITNARLHKANEEERRWLRTLLTERHRLRGHVSHIEEHVRMTGAYGAVQETVRQAELAVIIRAFQLCCLAHELDLPQHSRM